MSETAEDRTAAIRREAAAEERAAIVQIIERYARQLSHGHGATGAQALQHIIEQIERREHASAGERT